MVKVEVDNFDVKQIAQSGQCFRMNEIGQHRFQVIAYGKRLVLDQVGRVVIFHCTEWEYKDLWRRYFDLETNYRYYIDHIDPEDTYLMAAVDSGGGIRILRQELWETLVSFVISQNNSIPRIKRSIETMCACYGEGHGTPEGGVFFTFPGPQVLAEANLEKLGLGYRDKYVKTLARNVADGVINLDTLAAMEPEEAESYLKSIYGVGAKVAACVQLYSLHQMGSFPVDTWMKKIIKDVYGGKFPVEMYSGFAGVIQQYIFYHARQQARAEGGAKG